MRQKLDPFRVPGPIDQGADDLLPGRIPVSMQDASLTVSPLTPQGEARPLSIEPGAPFDQLERARRPLLNEHEDRAFIAQSIPRLKGVAVVQRDLVIVGEDRRKTTLSLVGGGIGRPVLGQDRHTPTA